MKKINPQQVKDHFNNLTIDNEGKDYISYHSKRYAEILNIIAEVEKKNLSVLDIGPAFQTILIKNSFPQHIVDSLGFDFNLIKRNENERHYYYDLNKTQNEQDWIKVDKKYDIIVFTEVIEHLYTSPTHVLRFVRTLLKKDGILILQTPNAVTLPYRILMLLGRNPYMLLSEDANNHAHFREYTLKEMKRYLTNAGFTINRAYRKNYFYRPQLVFKLFLFLCWFLPASFRQGLTLVAKG